MTSSHVVVAALHAVLGHVGSSLVYRARYGRSALVVYRAGASPHRMWSRIAGLAAIAWAAGFVASAYSAWWIAQPFGRALFVVPWQLAWGIALGGLTLMLAAQVTMGAAFRIGQDERDAPVALRRTGIHARCRNPIYVGSWLALAGMTLWHPSIAMLATCLCAGISIHRLVRAEETFLRARFGAEFDAYCAVTPRYGWRSR